MARVRLEKLSVAFTRDQPAVDHVSVDLVAGELFCLLGPSGCGKSTLLRLIGGYLKPDAGRVWMDDREVTAEPPERRNTGMVFQNYALFPHLSALDNVAFPLRVRGIGKAARHAQAHEMLDWIGLTQDERLRRPAQLSGGQQQRVALARALVAGPGLLMLDEPFANLDRLLRERLREEMRDIQRRTGTTTILVTHDREEAFAIADRIAVMHRGRLLQIGTPSEVHDRPANAIVADFLGHRNLFRIEQSDEGMVFANGTRFPLHGHAATTGDHLLLRPEALRLHVTETSACQPGTVRQSRFAGTHALVTLVLDSGAVVEVQRGRQEPSLVAEQRVWLEIPPEALSIISGKEVSK